MNCEDEKGCKSCEFYNLLKGCLYDPRTLEEIVEPLLPNLEILKEILKERPKRRMIRIGGEEMDGGEKCTQMPEK